MAGKRFELNFEGDHTINQLVIVAAESFSVACEIAERMISLGSRPCGLALERLRRVEDVTDKATPGL